MHRANVPLAQKSSTRGGVESMKLIGCPAKVSHLGRCVPRWLVFVIQSFPRRVLGHGHGVEMG
jgi:hypothetical protein